MISLSYFGFLAVVQIAASSTQNPPLTDCSGLDESAFQVTSMIINNAKLGEVVQFDAVIIVKEVVSGNPVVHVSFSKPSGFPLPCVQSVVPCWLKACDGTTDTELLLNADWDNKCPIQPGNYTSELTYKLPDYEIIKLFLGDGNIIMKLNVVDNGEVLGCVSYPVAVDVN